MAESLTMEEIKESTEDIINRAKAENLPMVYILKEQYAKIDPAIIHQKERSSIAYSFPSKNTRCNVSKTMPFRTPCHRRYPTSRC